MGTETDIAEIKKTLSGMQGDISKITTGIAVIQTTSQVTQGDVEEIKATLKNHDGRIRMVEMGLEAQKTRTDTQSVIVGIFSAIGSLIAAILGTSR